MSYLGWTVLEWTQYHYKSTPDESFKLLSELLGSQKTSPSDPAWISLASQDNLKYQWNNLQSKQNKSELLLYGVPIAIKDNIDVKGFETTAACPAYAYKPNEDATTVKLLRNAGAIIIGKTNLDQFATGLVGTRSPYGITPNTFNAKYVSGGSSSGSASVVARGIVPIALGTDTAGSGRVPAALNNLIGLKPTRGIFSCKGVVPACKSLDCVSFFALNIRDAQLVFTIMAHEDGDDEEYSRELPFNPLIKFASPPRIGVPTNLLWYGEKENPKLFNQAIEVFRKLDFNLVSLNIEPLLELAKYLYEGPWVAERYNAIRDFYATNPPISSLDPTVTAIIKGGEKYSAATAFEYEYKRQKILQKVKKLLKNIDALIVPTAPLTPTIEEVLKEPVKINAQLGTYTNFANLADMCALAIPAGFRPDGVPFGITLLSRKFNDYALLELAHRYLKLYSKQKLRFYGALKHRRVSFLDDKLLNHPLPNPATLINVAIVSAHLKGFQFHLQFSNCNAVFLESTYTSSKYKLFELNNVRIITRYFLRRIEKGGTRIAMDIYGIPKEKFGDFIDMDLRPLSIGCVELESGKWVMSFICEEFVYRLPGVAYVSEFDWKKDYQGNLAKERPQTKKPFNSVLIANRGEIAVRIIKTLKKLRVRSIAVYSDTDKYSNHVLLADIAVPLNGHSVAETYICIDKIIKAAKDSGAAAIIPGYGFLSENADFSDRCEKEGIVFIGPPGDIIRKLGLKHSARKIAANVGIPLIIGSDLISNSEIAKKIATQLGYPVMVKSTAGGGGIGLQKVDSEDEIEKAFQTVQRQGKSYFSNTGIFLEKFIENARHIEIQIFGDGRGNAIALGDRDCSLQRRNQKIIEETPAPNLSDLTRLKMRQAAESLCTSINYKSIGTVEFIYDKQRDEFYFLEVNTRLQVEHPITEMVTGLDLIEWMLYIAADNPPNFNQNINVTGVSMEARLYAENPVKDFMPSIGQLTEVKFPSWARIDGWIEKGTIISADYDPTLAKVIVHGEDRNDALMKLRQALDETIVYGCMTNIDYLRSIVNSDIFAQAKITTKVLDSYDYRPAAFEILDPGAYTTVQDYPGRKGYWHVGVPPSGCMDDYSFRLANRIVGNDISAPGIEITLKGPKILFHHNAIISVTGGVASVNINGQEAKQWVPLNIRRGDKISIGQLKNGCRAYMAIRGGIDVTKYLGSRSTFALGNLGGYNGRILKLGDVLFFGQPEILSCMLPTPIPNSLIPSYDLNICKVGVTCGPHGSPDFFTPESIKDFFTEKWKVHYNSNRFGVRLIGPNPKWARPDGGDAGLHPSNTHDYVYSLGAINFTGDEPVILTCDGPSLGGFVCEAVVVEAEMWKIGQVKPGDLIQFVPINYKDAKSLKANQDKIIENLKGSLLEIECRKIEPENPILYEFKVSLNAPKITYRQAGDRYILVEYGENVLDLNLCYRIHQLIGIVKENKTTGIVEMSQGVRSVLIEFSSEITQFELLRTLISYEKKIVFVNNWEVESRIIKLPMAFEDKKTLGAIKRYQETIRSEAPWLPNNVDFIANINGLTRNDVKNIVYTARFLVLGLGDVFLGAPCAVPLDPRHRLLGTKYNPSRTFTPNGTVGIGGSYMCIYTMESPGGYQLIGRTIPIWDKLTLCEHSGNKPWLLSPFDQVEFYPVTEEEIDKFSEEMRNGRFKVDIMKSVFNHTGYLEWVQKNSESIEKFQKNQRERLEEFGRLIQTSNSKLVKSDIKVIDNVHLDENVELVYSEYTGRVWKLLVEVGDEVKKDQDLIAIEAMKTEIIASATKSGKVLKIYHKNGEMVNAGDLIVVLG